MDPLLEKLAGAVIGTLLAAIGILWKELHKWQQLYLTERQKRREERSEHYQTSEMFLEALAKRRRQSSDPPPSSR